jgi:predicted metal-binding membrane protein
VVGLTPQATLDRGIEAIVRRDRRVAGASLVLVVALAWLYLWHARAAMGPMDMGDMPMEGMAHALGTSTLALNFVMWTVMMVGMMLPGAAPTILLYGGLVRKNGERGTVLPAVWVFTSGYLAVWTGFSVAATVLQAALGEALLLTPTMESSSRGLSAAILFAAGIYQWLPVKEVCLHKCRHPLEFFMTRWRSGTGGAFRMGAEHGAYCVGCCWVLMLLLFVAGVMNLVWVAAIAAFVLVEKLLPAGRFATSFAGVGLVLSGVYLLLAP